MPHRGYYAEGMELELQSMLRENKGVEYHLKVYNLLQGLGLELFFVPVVVQWHLSLPGMALSHVLDASCSCIL